MTATKPFLRAMTASVRKMVFENNILKLLFLKCSLIVLVVLGVGISQYFAIGPFSTYAKEDSSICGNGIVEDKEECDDGNNYNYDGCKNDCKIGEIKADCGNAIVESDEECDDGNDNSYDGCKNDCKIGEIKPICGNGIVEEDEQCDDGNTINSDGCSKYCVIERYEPYSVCGNGIVESDEQCDDGNLANNDGCSKYCKMEEHKVTICHIPQGNPENMQTIIVDENSVNYIAHLSHGDYTGECIVPVNPICGNGVLETGEQCDDGNLNNNDGCDQYCEIENPPEPICGNGVLEGDEQCDLGTENGQNQGCSLICTTEEILPVCGNVILEGNEQCDDGNLNNEDGCSEHCLIEIPNPICGNDLLEAGEECEEGNTFDRDGCSNACALEIPIVTLVSTPPYGNLPLTVTITSTKEPWAKYLSFDYGDGTPVINNPAFPLIHVYPNVGDYTVRVTAKSNFTGQIAPGYTLPQVRAETLEQVTVTRCGDTIMGKGEQCEFMTGALHTGCTDLCKRVVPAPSCYLALNESLVIFDHPIDFTFSNLTERESPYLLDFDDGAILTGELSNGLMTYTHGYNINNYTFNDFVPTIYVMNNIAAAAGRLILGSCSQALASIGQDYSWVPHDTVIVNTGSSSPSTASGTISIAAMIFPSITFNKTQLFVLNGSQQLTTIADPNNIILSNGSALDVSRGITLGSKTINPLLIIRVTTMDDGGFTFDVKDAIGEARMQEDTYVMGDADRDGKIRPPLQEDNVLKFGGTDTDLLFSKPVKITIEGYPANEFNLPKRQSAGDTERHDILTVCDTPYGVEPTNIDLEVAPHECRQTDGTNTIIRTFHATTFMVPTEEESLSLFWQIKKRFTSLFAL